MRSSAGDQEMKATIERATLLKGLSHVQSVVERRNTIPILSNVLLEATAEGQLRMMATDLDLQINDSVAAAVDQPGSTTVSAHTLFDIARKLPEGAQVQLTAAEGRMTIVAGRARFSLGTLGGIQVVRVHALRQRHMQLFAHEARDQGGIAAVEITDPKLRCHTQVCRMAHAAVGRNDAAAVRQCPQAIGDGQAAAEQEGERGRSHAPALSASSRKRERSMRQGRAWVPANERPGQGL